MNKTILIILDGLEYKVAQNCMGYLSAMCDEGFGKLYQIKSELPSISRPLYECILTGVKPINSGVLSNLNHSLSKEKSIFSYIKEANLKAGAAAYHWVSELYNKTPFDPILHRHTEDESLNIPYGMFYYEDHYPDSHLFCDGEHLRRKYDLDFTLFHSMNIDNAGHLYSYNSKEYRNFAREADIIISNLLQTWLDENLNVIITADHGMNDDFSHGGILECETNVPFFVFGEAFSLKDTQILQTQICGTICEILGIKHDKNVCFEILRNLQGDKI